MPGPFQHPPTIIEPRREQREDTHEVDCSRQDRSQQFARAAAMEWEEILPDIFKLYKWMSRVLDGDEETVRDSLAAMGKLHEESKRVASEVEIISVLDNAVLEQLVDPLQTSKTVIRQIKTELDFWVDSIKAPKTFPWAFNIEKERRKTIEILKTVGARVNASSYRFERLVLLFLETYVEEMSGEIFKLR